MLALRELLGLTQNEVARTLRISQSALSKIEKAERPITPDLIDRASTSYGLPRRFFHIPPNATEAGIPTFRKASTAKVSDERRIVRHCREAARIYSTAADQAGYHTSQIPHDLASREVEEAASRLRAITGLSPEAPVPNMTRFLEKLGVGVIAHLDDGPEAVAQHMGVSIPESIPSRPLVALPHPLPGAVARFTLAHELAHHIWDQNTTQSWTGRRAPQEQRAHAFANALLLPTSVLRRRVTERLTLAAYLAIKADYGISVSAIITAAKRAGVISSERARSLRIQHSARGWHNNEPVHVASERPLLLKQCLHRITVWDSASIADTTAMPAATIARWIDEAIPSAAPIISLQQWRNRSDRIRRGARSEMTSL